MVLSLTNLVGLPLSKASDWENFPQITKKVRHQGGAFFINVYFCRQKISINQNSTTMKKITFALLALLAFTFSMKAQQFVSTTPTNRNVILEEFTGRNCQYCPDGHAIANQIAANNPGRFWAVNVHAGSFSPTSFPNLNTTDSEALRAGFGVTSFPSGVVNRSTSTGQSRSAWNNLTNQQLNQASECNVAGMVIVNPETRIATITVEVYYTANSSADENYLTVAMLQDSILGSQSGGATYNPGQMINGQYVHMHSLRDVINDNVWGDAISPTTQGSLITRTYEYEIPEIIGSPNGVAVDLNNISFLAWVSERYQGTPTRPILTGCELDLVQGTNEPIYPSVIGVSQLGTTCSHTKDIEVNIQNIGLETLTSMTVVAELNGQTYTANWEGELPRFGIEKIMMSMEVPFGTYPVTVTVTEANGEPQSHASSGSVTCMEWNNLEIEGEEEQLRLELMQDKFGNQITWEFTASDGTILASGGPYDMLLGGNATQMQLANVTVPAGECVKFTIHDSGNNGICCNTGQGYYIVKDSHGNVVFGDQNDGDFGSEASHLVSIIGATQVSVGETEVSGINYNHADFAAPLVYEGGYPDEVGFVCRKVTSAEPMIIQGFLNEFHNILGFTDELEPSSIYMVKAYAIVNGQTYNGVETTFQTWMEGVDELSQTLKVYPNPTSSVLNIEGKGMTNVEVYNAMGQRVMMVETNDNAIQLNTVNMSNGMYVVRIYANDGTVLNRTFSVAR